MRGFAAVLRAFGGSPGKFSPFVAFSLFVIGVAPALAGGSETINQALCRVIEKSAKRYELPIPFLTRLIWMESNFRPAVVSPAGAQGIAQFMPGTAAERGLANPFDPQQAIPKSAQLLAELQRRFGNLGLAAAAYNAGPARVASWLQKSAPLPAETRAYVLGVTGHPADEWARAARHPDQFKQKEPLRKTTAASCTTQLASLEVTSKAPAPIGDTAAAHAIFEPWGVQLAGAFNKAMALAEYRRRIKKYRKAIGAALPMIIGTRLQSRGSRPFYRIRIPERTRAAANAQCRKIRAIGGSCVVLRS